MKYGDPNRVRVLVTGARDPAGRRNAAKKEADAIEASLPPSAKRRPKTRGDCLEGGINAARPCPWVGCKHHLVIEANLATGAVIGLQMDVITLDTNRVATIDWDRVKHSCTLDVVESNADGMTFDAIAEILHVTRARAQQVEDRSLLALKGTVLTSRDDHETLVPDHLWVQPAPIVRPVVTRPALKVLTTRDLATELPCLGCSKLTKVIKRRTINPLDVGFCPSCKHARRRLRNRHRVLQAKFGAVFTPKDKCRICTIKPVQRMSVMTNPAHVGLCAYCARSVYEAERRKLENSLRKHKFSSEELGKLTALVQRFGSVSTLIEVVNQENLMSASLYLSDNALKLIQALYEGFQEREFTTTQAVITAWTCQPSLFSLPDDLNAPCSHTVFKLLNGELLQQKYAVAVLSDTLKLTKTGCAIAISSTNKKTRKHRATRTPPADAFEHCSDDEKLVEFTIECGDEEPGWRRRTG